MAGALVEAGEVRFEGVDAAFEIGALALDGE
jgi:hypothetical protein